MNTIKASNSFGSDQARCYIGPDLDTNYLSHAMRFPTMWYVRSAKSQTSLRICAVWSELLLWAWIFYDCKATYQTAFPVSKLKKRLHRLLWVSTCQNSTLFEIACHALFSNVSSNMVCVTSKGSDQPAHMHSLIRAFASCLNILWLLRYWPNSIWSF